MKVMDVEYEILKGINKIIHDFLQKAQQNENLQHSQLGNIKRIKRYE